MKCRMKKRNMKKRNMEERSTKERSITKMEVEVEVEVEVKVEVEVEVEVERSIPEKGLGRSLKRMGVMVWGLSPNQSSSRKSFPRLNATKRMVPKVSNCCLEPTFWATLMIWISA